MSHTLGDQTPATDRERPDAFFERRRLPAKRRAEDWPGGLLPRGGALPYLLALTSAAY
ncbi:MAG: hypothetical protein LLG00_13905 [Planctomycetaceae bacterium]|nr:hypothetical protein [Planctomycetaceae bacterium]